VDLGVGGTLVFTMLLFGLCRELRSTDIGLAAVENALQAELSGASKGSLVLKRHLADVRFMRATAAAFFAYVFVRMIVGIFGHDLYEIYWWLAAGGSMAIVNMQPLVEARTAQLLGQGERDR
jgi:putative inorganic carbon (hco3(-)) transporter